MDSSWVDDNLQRGFQSQLSFGSARLKRMKLVALYYSIGYVIVYQFKVLGRPALQLDP